MKLSDLEKQFNEFSRHQEVIYANSIDNAGKNKVWGKVQSTISIKRIRIPAWTLVAASVSLLVVASFGYFGIHARNEQIAQLKQEIEQLELNKSHLQIKFTDLADALTKLQNQPPRIDTVFKTKIVYKERKIFAEQVPEKPSYDDEQQMSDYNKVISLGDERIDLASIENDVESIKIEYGKVTKGGKTPWVFTVKYN